MPIGKNSLKRVANNGYSNVKTEAPDMENSTEEIEKNVKKEPPKTASVSKKTVSAKSATKKAAQKEEVIKPAEEKKAELKVEGHEYTYINIGEGLPIYLL